MRYLVAICALAGIYALALASADPWDLWLGAVLGTTLVFGFRSFLFTKEEIPGIDLFRRLAQLPALAAATTAEIARGTVMVARAVLSPELPRHDGFVVIPDGERTATGVVVSGLLNTLSPGSVLIDIDPDVGSWTIHALDTTDAPGIVEDAQRFYERYQRPVWP